MYDYIVLEILLILFLVFMNGFFVAAEFAIVKVRSTQIDILENIRPQKRKSIKGVIEQLDTYLSATQLGITLASLGLGWIGEPTVAKILNPLFRLFGFESEVLIHSISLIVAFMIITFLHIVFGELAPKSLAIQRPQSVVVSIVFPLRLFFRIFKPIIWALNHTALKALKIVGVTLVSESERSHSQEEIQILISESSEAGLITDTEKTIIQRTFEFDNMTVEDTMIPRTLIIAVDINSTVEEIIDNTIDEGFSRIPVYEDTIDNIIGIIYSKDLLKMARNNDFPSIRQILRPAYFVSGTMTISALLKEMQRKNQHLAIAIDEYAGVQGIITIEDILEEIVGEIHDEYDIVSDAIIRMENNEALVKPYLTIRQFNKEFDTNIPSATGYKTLSGFLLKIAEKVPKLNDTIYYENIIFKITKREDNRISEVKIKIRKTGDE